MSVRACVSVYLSVLCGNEYVHGVSWLLIDSFLIPEILWWVIVVLVGFHVFSSFSSVLQLVGSREGVVSEKEIGCVCCQCHMV